MRFAVPLAAGSALLAFVAAALAPLALDAPLARAEGVPFADSSQAGDALRPGLAAGVASGDEWRRAASLGVALDAVVGREWVTAHAGEREIDAIVWRLSRVQWESRTPAILHFYYWGDDAHRRECFVEAGLCEGRSVAEWRARAGALGDAIARWTPPGLAVIVVVETEIDNDAADQRAHAAWWERDLPALMREVASTLASRSGGRAEPATSLGAWAPESYAKWAALLRAPEFAFAGFQTSGNHEREGERCPVDDYATLFERRTLRAAEAMARVAPGKPLGAWDVFVSSHGASGERDQARYFADLASGRDRLASLGVRWIAVRSLEDDPAQAGCLGEDERHFGFLARGRAKPSFDAFVDAFAHPRAQAGRIEVPQHATAGARALDAEATLGESWRLPAGAHARATFRVPSTGAFRAEACLGGEGHAIAEVLLGARSLWKGTVGEYATRGATVHLDAGSDATILVRAIGPGAVRLDSLRLAPAGAAGAAVDACGRATLAPVEAYATEEIRAVDCGGRSVDARAADPREAIAASRPCAR